MEGNSPNANLMQKLEEEKVLIFGRQSDFFTHSFSHFHQTHAHTHAHTPYLTQTDKIVDCNFSFTNHIHPSSICGLLFKKVQSPLPGFLFW